jgi:CDP-L-myo-inositol myo-inositolphosphotransferase
MADKYDSLMQKLVGPNRSYFRIGRDLRMFLIFVGAVFNQVFLILILTAVIMNVENIRRILLVYKNSQIRTQ